MLYNNGINRPGIIKILTLKLSNLSWINRAIIQMTRPFLPVSPVWIYGDSITSQFYSPNYSSAQMSRRTYSYLCRDIGSIV